MLLISSELIMLLVVCHGSCANAFLLVYDKVKLLQSVNLHTLTPANTHSIWYSIDVTLHSHTSYIKGLMSDSLALV